MHNLTMHKKISFFTYFGAVPFIVAPILYAGGWIEKEIGVTLFKTYSLVILCFMAGLVFERHKDSGENSADGITKIIISRIYVSFGVTLASWFGFLILESFWFIGLNLGLFGVLLGCDALDLSHHKITSQFYNLRKRISSLVIFMHAVMMWILS